MKENKRSAQTLWQLFKATFLLSAFTFGGGFVIVSLMKKKFVEELKWLDESEMLDITAIAQSSPGPIPINASVILGYRMYGVVGSLVAILGTALPPMIIISVISVFYTQFRSNRIIAIALQVMRAGVAAVIFDVVINLAKNVVATKRASTSSSWPPPLWARSSWAWTHDRDSVLPGGGPGRSGPGGPQQEKGGGVNEYSDAVIPRLYPGRHVQCGRRLRRHPPHPEPDRGHPRSDDSGGIHRPYQPSAEMTPGPISINSATFVGMRLAGIPGVLLCTLGCIIPSFCICLALAHFYYKYRSFSGVQTVLSALRPAVVASSPPPGCPSCCWVCSSLIWPMWPCPTSAGSRP